MENNVQKVAYYFRKTVKAYVPVAFFIIAATEGNAYPIAGIGVVLYLAYLTLQYAKIGEGK